MNKLKPSNLLFTSFLIWIIFFIITPYTYFFDKSPFDAVVFIFFSFLFFIIGSIISTNTDLSHKSNDKLSSKSINRFFYGSLLAGIIGGIIRIYQRIFTESVLMYDNFTEYRFASSEAYYENTIIDAIGSLLYPFGIASLLMYIYYGKQIKINKYFVWMVAGTYPLEGIFLGGRLNIIFFATMIFFAFQIKSFSQNRVLIGISLKKIIPVLLALMIFLMYSANILTTRFDQMGFTFESYIMYLEVVRNVEIDNNFLSYLVKNNFSNFSFLSYVFVEIIHYFHAGVIEFIKLYHFNDGDYTYWMGVHQFSIYLKFFSIFGIENLPSYVDTLESYHQVGQYTSFVGSALIDFGEYTPIYMFILGILSGKTYNSAIRGEFNGIMIFPFIASVIVYSPMINFLMNQTLYILNALILLIIISKVRMK